MEIIDIVNKGRRIIGRQQVQNGSATIYTVATNCVFYLLHYAIDILHGGAGDHWGQLHIVDVGDITRPIRDLSAPDTVDAMTGSGDVVIKLVAGEQVKIQANATTIAIGNIIGVEIPIRS